jgi:hypothetical protein
MRTTMASSFVFRAWILKAAEMRTIATGVNALSIWMKETLRVKYAELLRMSEPEKRIPMGIMRLM